MNDPAPDLDRFLRAARSVHQDTDRTAMGFETRLLARLREERESVTWFSGCWRLVPAFAAAVAAGALAIQWLPDPGAIPDVASLLAYDSAEVWTLPGLAP